MSKSNGAVLTVSVLEQEGYDPLAFRFMCLNSHYRKQLVFSYDALDQAAKTLNKLKNRISNIEKDGDIQEDKYEFYNNKFKEELSNDLNVANTITILYDLLKDEEVNGNTKLKLISDFDKVWSLDLVVSNETDSELVKYIEEKIEERSEAKKNKDFAKADKIREELLSKGIELLDTREGTTYKEV
jgi:cysteinyl-tRNA synthetase